MLIDLFEDDNGRRYVLNKVLAQLFNFHGIVIIIY